MVAGDPSTERRDPGVRGLIYRDIHSSPTSHITIVNEGVTSLGSVVDV